MLVSDRTAQLEATGEITKAWVDPERTRRAAAESFMMQTFLQRVFVLRQLHVASSFLVSDDVKQEGGFMSTWNL